jgi:cell division initiation protein
MSIVNITPKIFWKKSSAKSSTVMIPSRSMSFLDDLIKQFESLLEENEEVLVKNEALKSEVAKLKQKTDKIEDIEDKLMNAVITAQKNATMYIEKAEAQARKITEIANQNAKTVIESTHLRMEAAGQELKKYEKVISDFKRKFKLFLEEQAAYVDMKLDDDDTLATSAAEVSRSINNLTQQIRIWMVVRAGGDTPKTTF